MQSPNFTHESRCWGTKTCRKVVISAKKCTQTHTYIPPPNHALNDYDIEKKGCVQLFDYSEIFQVSIFSIKGTDR